MPTSLVGKISRGRRNRLAHQDKPRGVTLIEMMVVVAIIGVITAVSFPSASAGIASVRLVSATDSVATFLNSAVNRVERRQQPIELEISLRENRLSLYSNEPGFRRELKMGDGIVIEAVLPPVGDEGAEDGGDLRRFILMPGATVPGIGIQIANQRGAHRVVRLDPMTGFPRVESVNPK
jgi:prepilin-type N-terminal cleavage/methylation domain-containing protein